MRVNSRQPDTTSPRAADPGSRLGVALVSEEYPPFYGGGIGTYAAHIAKALAEAGLDVHVVTLAADDTHPRHEHDATVAGATGSLTVHRVTPWPAGTRAGEAAWFAVAAAQKVAELAAAGLVQVAEFAECGGAGVGLSALARLLPASPAARVPTIVHFHTPTEVLFELRSLSEKRVSTSLATLEEMERLAILLADGWCAPSRFIAAFAEDRYGLPTRPEVIPYALRNKPAACAPVPESPTVLFVGRLEPRKGLRVLLAAWRRVVEARPDAELRLVGADTNCGPDGAWYGRWLLNELPAGVRDRVTVVGPLPPDRLGDEQARARVAVVPSLWENFPFTCIEAMAAGRPMVVADQGRMAEMVEGSGAGLIAPSGDADALADAIIELLNEPTAKLAERGAMARQRITTMCDPELVVGQRVDMYRRAIARRCSGDRPAVDADARLDAWRRIGAIGLGDAAGGVHSLDRAPMSAKIRPWLDAEAATAGASA